MILCEHCGVELDKGMKICPLCGRTSGTEPVGEKPEQSDYYPSDIISVHKEERRKHLWEISGIIAFSGIVVCTIVDFELSKKISWSLFADTSVAAAWICLTLILLAFKKYFIVIPGLLITILTMLFLFDLISGSLTWFYPIGLPITVAFFVSVTIITLLWKIAHFRGFNILAIAFLILSLFCMVTEAFIDKYAFNSIEIRWSAIVAVSILPIALLLLFVQYRMKRGNRLDSY
jgi:hypothetical protein